MHFQCNTHTFDMHIALKYYSTYVRLSVNYSYSELMPYTTPANSYWVSFHDVY